MSSLVQSSEVIPRKACHRAGAVAEICAAEASSLDEGMHPPPHTDEAFQPSEGMPVCQDSSKRLLASERIPVPPTPLVEPMLYLSSNQQAVLDVNGRLKEIKDKFTLPCWVPQRLVAEALNYGQVVVVVS